jgi:hypothetical protein
MSQHCIEWPTDILRQFLRTLSVICDSSAQRAWGKLAFIVCKRDELAQFARNMPRPILLRVEADATNAMFKIPFMQATLVCVDVDWGDGCVDKLRESGNGYAEHKYAVPGEYAVRVFSAHEQSGEGLDHLGFEESPSSVATASWWRPLVAIVSLGNCGLRSLSWLFAHSRAMKADLQWLVLGEVSNLSAMFFASEFDQPIGGWNVSRVTNMYGMFGWATAFDQPIGEWNVSNVNDVSFMFHAASEFN